MRARLAVVVLAALALPASAQAHAFLESSTPANGTSLGRAPHVVSLHFTEPVSAGLAHVQLFDGRGRQRAGVRVRGGRTASELVVSLPALGTGAYRIAWSTVSQDDLHVTRGALVFGAGAAAPAIRASAGATPPTSLTESAAHLLDLVSLSILIAVCGLLAGPLPAAVRARVTRFGLAALPALLVAGMVALDDKASQLPLRDVLAHTAWGHAMVARELAVAAVATALALRRPQIAFALLVPVAATEAAGGHAAAQGALALGAMTLHILAAGLWVGGLIVLGLVLPGAERRDIGETIDPLRPPRRGQRRPADRHGPLQRRPPGREPGRPALDDVWLVADRQARAARRDGRPRAPWPAVAAPCAALAAAPARRGDRGGGHSRRRFAPARERSRSRAAVRPGAPPRSQALRSPRDRPTTSS